MHSTVLLLHSWLRWLIVVAGLLALLRQPLRSDRDGSGLLFTILMDLQLLLGLALYFALSPLTKAGFQNMHAAMQNDQLRYWVVEHPFGMVVAIVLAHLGRVKPRWRNVFFVLAIIIVLTMTPWPGLHYGRPLFRKP